MSQTKVELIVNAILSEAKLTGEEWDRSYWNGYCNALDDTGDLFEAVKKAALPKLGVLEAAIQWWRIKLSHSTGVKLRQKYYPSIKPGELLTTDQILSIYKLEMGIMDEKKQPERTLKEIIHATPEYKSMNTYRACEIAEGFGSGEEATDQEKQAAWQYLHDTEAAYVLQGWYGRTATVMINQGFIAR